MILDEDFFVYMIYKELDFEYNKETVVQEIMSCSSEFSDIAPYAYWINLAKNKKVFMVESLDNYENITLEISGKKILKAIPPPRSFYIRSSDFLEKSYVKSKNQKLDFCIWNPKVVDKLSYTKNIIEKLPLENIGLVRVFITENTFLPTHHDRVNSDKTKNKGISLVPIHSGSPLMFYDPEIKQINKTLSSAFVFDDSYLHGIPITKGLRIDIRVFGLFKD